MHVHAGAHPRLDLHAISPPTQLLLPLFVCCRNLIGGFGPVAVAKLAEGVGLQHAMLLAPACYLLSGLTFLVAEKEIEQQETAARAASLTQPPAAL
jgi:hypothetical protein